MYYIGIDLGGTNIACGIVDVNGKLLLKIVYITAAVLVFGLAMCLCLVWAQYLYGMLVGLVGVLMLLGLIPMFKGLK